MPWFYYVAGLILRILLFLLTRWQVRGKENIPSQGPLLVIANHLHLADPPLVGFVLGRKAAFMAKKELFKSRLTRYIMSYLGAFPVHREQLDRQALRQARRVLDEGGALVMFPEGTRSQSGRLRPAFSGSASVAIRSGVPILPIGIAGTEKINGAAWILQRPRIIINIGHPFNLPPANSKLTKAELTEVTNHIMERIAELLPPEYRGSYAGRGN